MYNGGLVDCRHVGYFCPCLGGQEVLTCEHTCTTRTLIPFMAEKWETYVNDEPRATVQWKETQHLKPLWLILSLQTLKVVTLRLGVLSTATVSPHTITLQYADKVTHTHTHTHVKLKHTHELLRLCESFKLVTTECPGTVGFFSLPFSPNLIKYLSSVPNIKLKTHLETRANRYLRIFS